MQYRVQYGVLKSDNPHESTHFMGISLIKIDIELSNSQHICGIFYYFDLYRVQYKVIKTNSPHENAHFMYVSLVQGWESIEYLCIQLL